MASGGMWDVDVIEDPAAAAVALDPVRSRLLAELAEPGSAAALAPKVGLSRQKVNYHLRALEEHGLVRVAEERRHGGLTERLLVATARSFVVAPAALGSVAADTGKARDRLSARYLISLASRMVGEVAGLVRKAERAGKRLPTLCIDTELRFRDAAERAAFTEELTCALSGLIARYHDECAPGGRSYRLVVASHPLPATGAASTESTTAAESPAVQEVARAAAGSKLRDRTAETMSTKSAPEPSRRRKRKP